MACSSTLRAGRGGDFREKFRAKDSLSLRLDGQFRGCRCVTGTFTSPREQSPQPSSTTRSARSRTPSHREPPTIVGSA